MKDIRLQDAFTPVPEGFRQSMNRAFLEMEEKKVKRKLVSSMLAVATLLLLFGCVAALSVTANRVPHQDLTNPHRIAAQPGASGSPAASMPASTAALEFWTTEAGGYFHLDPLCSGMENAFSVSYDDAQAQGKQPCPVCVVAPATPSPGATLDPLPTARPTATPDPLPTARPTPTPIATPEPTEQPMYWSTDHGVYYHAIRNCSGMKGATAVSAEVAENQRRQSPCPVCIPSPSEMQNAGAGQLPAESPTFWTTGGGSYYHALRDCSGMKNPIAITLEDAQAAEKVACPKCVEPSVLAEEAALCWATEKGIYYHTVENCSGMEGATEIPLVYAQAQGKLPCPVCVAVPEIACRVIGAAGFLMVETEYDGNLEIDLFPDEEATRPASDGTRDDLFRQLSHLFRSSDFDALTHALEGADICSFTRNATLTELSGVNGSENPYTFLWGDDWYHRLQIYRLPEAFSGETATITLRDVQYGYTVQDDMLYTRAIRHVASREENCAVEPAKNVQYRCVENGAYTLEVLRADRWTVVRLKCDDPQVPSNRLEAREKENMESASLALSRLNPQGTPIRLADVATAERTILPEQMVCGWLIEDSSDDWLQGEYVLHCSDGKNLSFSMDGSTASDSSPSAA